MKFSEFIIEGAGKDKENEIITWLKDKSILFTSLEGSIHWNTRDNAIHLSNDIHIKDVEENIPFSFTMCAKNFHIEGGKLTKLCFNKNSVIMGSLQIENLHLLQSSKDMPSYVNSLEVLGCDLLKELRLPVINTRLTVKRCSNLRKIDEIDEINNIRLISLPNLTRLPVIKNIDSLEELWISACGNLDIMNEPKPLTGLKYLYLGPNKGMSLKGIEKVMPNLESLNLGKIDDPVKSHVLGLLLINSLNFIETVTNSAPNETGWIAILNKYLSKDRKDRKILIDCQNELIDAGFEEYAQL